MAYSTGYIALPSGLSTVIGLCLNQYCTADVLNQLKKETMEFMVNVGLLERDKVDLSINPYFYSA